MSAERQEIAIHTEIVEGFQARALLIHVTACGKIRSGGLPVRGRPKGLRYGSGGRPEGLRYAC
jgi:hypothetical protein